MVKINPLFFAVVAIVYFTGAVLPFVIMFCTLMLHELVHLFFLAKNGIHVERMTIEPFGISIISKGKNVENAIVYLSAPVFNLFLGTALYFCIGHNVYLYYFVIANIATGLLNLIPVKPFDGGRALDLYLFKKFGEIATLKITNILGFFVSFLLILFGSYAIFKFNFSIAIIGVFLLYNAITEKRRITEKMISHYSSLEKRGNIIESMPVVYLAVSENYPAHKMIKRFLPDSYYMVKVIKNGIVIKTLTETQIVSRVVHADKSLKIKDC